MNVIRRSCALLVALALLNVLQPVRAFAQTDTGEINITVNDAGTKRPVVLARVLLDGPVVASEYTGDDGKVRFTEVPDGIYRARVFGRGYQAVTSSNFEVTNGKSVTVTVVLAQSQTGPLKTIANVVSKSSATVSTNTISNDSAQRKLSDTLADALGKLSGVNVATSSNDTDATQTVSLEGQDPSQTAMTLDGIPLNAPGMAGDMRAFNSDLFSGASVSFGPQIGGLAGGVNFRSLEPTISWQSEFSLAAGSNGKNNYSAAESGSLGKFGFAAMHTYRAAPSLLDGMTYLDASGLDYSHDGDRQQIGTLLKLRYQLNDAQTLTGMYMRSVNGAQLVCTQDTGPLPCGYGPNNSYDTNFSLYSLTDNALIGDTQLQAAFFGTRMNSTHDLLDRYIFGEASPTGTAQSGLTNGFSINATLPAHQRHTISVNAYATNSSSSFNPLVPQAAPYTFAGQHTSYAAVTINDTIRSNTKLRFTDTIGVSHASNSGGSLLLGLAANWQPTANDSYAFQYNIGGVAPHAGRQGFLTDPAALQFDCNGGIAYGSAPGDQPGASSSTSARLSYTHKMTAGLFSASVYRQVQNGIVLPVEVNGSALVNSGLFPPDYFDQAQGYYDTLCGVTPAAAFGPTNTYYSTPIANVQRVYEGAHLTGYFTIGNLVAEPYYDIQIAKANSNDPRFSNPYAITISGAQLPNVPLHRAGITLDYKSPHSIFEWLADANYTSANNPQNLPAYATVDAGVSAQLTHGTLAFTASNIFNAYGGVFASSQGAVPYTTLGGLKIPTIARPNTPRQYLVTYSVHFGQNVAPATTRAIAPPGNATFGPGGGPGGPRGGEFRQLLSALPESPPSDPFAISQTPLCTADAAKTAKPVLDALKAYVARINAAKTPAGYPATFAPPDIPGIAVQYHGLKSTYALSITVKAGSQLRSLFGCSSLHIADADAAQQRHLYVAPNSGVFFRPAVTFMPSVGLYLVRRQPQAGAESFRVYKLPATAPKMPFALRTASTCTAEMHTMAQTMLVQLQAHFASGAAAPSWTITPHSATGGTWYALDPSDIGAVPAIINCGHVAAASKTDLAKLGWDGSSPPTLNYAPALGLYLMTGNRGFGAGPRPSPSPTP